MFLNVKHIYSLSTPVLEQEKRYLKK